VTARVAALGVTVVVLSPVVGACAIALSIALSGTSWESADPGSSARLLPILVIPFWGALVYRLARRTVGHAVAALAIAASAALWSVGCWWLVVVATT
jgi:hypothetical protein